MPVITVFVFMVQGRTVDLKRALVKDVTNAIAGELAMDKDLINIYCYEATKEQVSKAGTLLCDL